uniref:Uncharacterized protein n=1 Tax=Klebsiella pneumoniae TaxID=573 RepID=A0A6G6ANE7_KLEPN|nr:hypothetical protein [Klebsiella pneumoniae]QIQ12923.1 hypothetical protein [Klebsiella pneumoniae]UFD96919.1 hypothetical protein [Klebsiella pneumoniae]
MNKTKGCLIANFATVPPRLPPPLSFSEDGCTERQKPTAL